MATVDHTPWRNRIVGYGDEVPDQLLANPKNWRIHPKAQQDALSGVLRDVGLVQNVIVNRVTGHVVDGHLRVALAISNEQPSIPVTYVDLTEAEEAEILATIDPLSAMAVADKEQLESILREVSTNDSSVQSLLDQLAGQSGESSMPPQQIVDTFLLITECADEPQLSSLYSRLQGEGYSLKTLLFQSPQRMAPAEKRPLPEIPGEIDLRLTSEVPETYRTARIRGMFDLPSATRREFHLHIKLDMDALPDWSVGIVTGASGTGKSSLARQLFGGMIVKPDGLVWSDGSILDNFPQDVPIDDVIEALTILGFSSVPNWLSPYSVLSMGEQFRATIARALVEATDGHPIVVDEYTSVVDRAVAKVCSIALSKAIRSQNRRFVAVTCHRDIIPWLEPDWVVDLDAGRFLWREIPHQPGIELRCYPASRDAWAHFRHAHYLSGKLSPTADCYVTSIQFGDDEQERLAGFISFIPAMGRRGWVRIHRQVVLPDFQGIGIGTRQQAAACEYQWESKGKRVAATGSSPTMTAYRLRHPDEWRMVQRPHLQDHQGSRRKRRDGSLMAPVPTAIGRIVSSWEYIPRGLRNAAP